MKSITKSTSADSDYEKLLSDITSLLEEGRRKIAVQLDNLIVPVNVPGQVTKNVTKRVIVKVGERLGERVGEKVGETGKKILFIIRKNNKATYKELSEKLNIAEKNIYLNVEKLKSKGLLRRIGPAKGGHWEVIE